MSLCAAWAVLVGLCLAGWPNGLARAQAREAGLDARQPASAVSGLPADAGVHLDARFVPDVEEDEDPDEFGHQRPHRLRLTPSATAVPLLGHQHTLTSANWQRWLPARGPPRTRL